MDFLDSLDRDFWDALDELVRGSEIVTDRPKGSAHPRYPGVRYPLDYGYLKGTASTDGEGVDVWIGPGERRANVVITVDPRKRDVEIKVLLGCAEHEADAVLRFHKEALHMGAALVRR